MTVFVFCVPCVIMYVHVCKQRVSWCPALFAAFGIWRAAVKWGIMPVQLDYPSLCNLLLWWKQVPFLERAPYWKECCCSSTRGDVFANVCEFAGMESLLWMLSKINIHCLLAQRVQWGQSLLGVVSGYGQLLSSSQEFSGLLQNECVRSLDDFRLKAPIGQSVDPCRF